MRWSLFNSWVLSGGGPNLDQRLSGISAYTYASRTRRMLKLLRHQFGGNG